MSEASFKPGNTPHSARIYDYFLGGKTNYRVDRKAAAATLAALPDVMTAARQNREFMQRSVRYLARERGMRQFLDIGTGIPTAPNLHQVAQQEQPTARVVYSDNDPIVLAHARALMTSTPEGATDYIEADVRDPEVILEHAGKTLDFAQPVTVSLVALLHFVPDTDDPPALVSRLLRDLAPGSALVLSHGTDDLEIKDETGSVHDVERVYRDRGIFLTVRPRESVAGFFRGLDLVEPGIVASCDWHPEITAPDEPPALPGAVSAAETSVWAGVGIKP
ncbi:SAM-dependent methyltransferase [Streptomyces sp. PU-14G]|uniref:SAM-dependent methyltransferase n=1 Tax=Streptomyces sp. PU-14G TaxID=2800808 RepID=UPI0034DFA28B